MNYALIYLSKATQAFPHDELHQLALQAQQRNAEKELSGLLLYSGEYFLQILEGEYTILNSLFQKISMDDRHNAIQVLLGAPAKERMFPNWSMGVIDIQKSEKIDPKQLEEICIKAEGEPEAAREAALEALKLFQYEEIYGHGADAA